MKSPLRNFASKTDKSYAHQYIEVYESLFEPIRDRVKNVLEIGIREGESHRMWRDYFDGASIHGIDVQDLCNGMIDEERIFVRFCDAYTDDAVASFGDLKFDVIVDDGPHSLESFKFVVEKYSALVADGGILVIEDVTYAEWIPEIAASVPNHLKMNSYCIDRRWVPNRNSINDELMFIIDKRFV